MPQRQKGIDPTTDQAAAEVLAAYSAAEAAGLPPVDCYTAGVTAWQRCHPDQTREHSARQAVAVIFAKKRLSRVPDAC
jgi:hypothetical protein